MDPQHRLLLEVAWPQMHLLELRSLDARFASRGGRPVGSGVALVAIGSMLGIAAALGLTRLLSSLLYGVGATDPTALAAAVLLLLGVGVAAAFIPARRASLTDPAVVLRQP